MDSTDIGAALQRDASKRHFRVIESGDELQAMLDSPLDKWRVYLHPSQRRLVQRDPKRLLFDDDMSTLWKEIVATAESPPGKSLPDSFYPEEWERIVQPNRIDSKAEYLKVSRAGRGVALSRRQRAVIWEVFEEMLTRLSQMSAWTFGQGTLHARDLVLRGAALPAYRHVVVDEAQDMGPEALMLVRALVLEGQNDLFLVGDGHQRIYRRRAVMSRCGIAIVGRARKLKINYRTTEQIRRFASALLEGQAIDDLDGGEDRATDYLSLTRGLEPNRQGFASQDDEIRWIATHVQALVGEDGVLGNCCLMLRTVKLRDEFARGLKDAGLDVVTLSTKSDRQSVSGVRVATMHRVKGLEFRHVFMAAMNRSTVPNKRALGGSDDITELRDKELAERALVHVCASRAIESLNVTWSGEASEYLTGSENR